jgi:AraC-like DNA-binding protein
VTVAQAVLVLSHNHVVPGSVALHLSESEQYQSSVRGSDFRVFVMERGSFAAKLTRIDLDRLWMQRAHLTLSTVVHSAILKQRSAIVFLADAEQAPMLNTGVEVAPGEIVRYSLGAEHHLRAPSGYHCCAMSLTPDDLAAFGRTLVGQELKAPIATGVVRPSPARMSRLQGLHKAASDLAATVPDMLAHPEVAKAIEQELVRAMIACLVDPEAQETYRSSRLRRPIMRRLEQMLEERLHEPLYVTDVCAGIGVSERSLRQHCQEHLGMSPHRYLWLRRMNLVRRALASAEPATRTVTEIANDYGFGELGRFAVSYRRLFGESPSTTLRRLPSATTRRVAGAFHGFSADIA